MILICRSMSRSRERAAQEARELQDRVEWMDEQGYSHKPLARRDMADEKVLDALEDWGVFDLTCTREDVGGHGLSRAG